MKPSPSVLKVSPPQGQNSPSTRLDPAAPLQSARDASDNGRSDSSRIDQRRATTKAELRAIQWFTLTHALGMLLFVLLMAALLWYLRNTETSQQQQALYRDIEVVQQALRLRWREHKEKLETEGASWAIGGLINPNQRQGVRDFIASEPDIAYIGWIDTERRIRWLQSASHHQLAAPRIAGSLLEDSVGFTTFQVVQDTKRSTFSESFWHPSNQVMLEVQAPVIIDSQFSGTLIMGYTLNRTLEMVVQSDIRKKYQMMIGDAGGNTLLSTSPRTIHDANLSYELPLDPPGRGMRLRAIAFETQPQLLERSLMVAVGGLFIASLVSLLLLWRHSRRRLSAEAESHVLLNKLSNETAFRRAMEDSVLTGMRTFDMAGTITYVNKAFCDMTGFEHEELVGAAPPYPYWPRDEDQFNEENLAMVLAGQSPKSGHEVRVQRKDGTIFDARMYVSPLVDPSGEQSGWMTSMTDITEPKRIREALAASQERVSTVLDELDAAVSVYRPEGDILFVNEAFRKQFGERRAETLVFGQPSFSQYLDEASGKWFDLRSREIRWVDGRLAHMLVAVDVSVRHELEEKQRQQESRLQSTSRLVTMGEMASSLAHELNQPLTAITNYCMGLSARIKSLAQSGERPDAQSLIEPLDKTARQAERAGLVIRRIREFVKRSEPERRACSVEGILSDALGLAEIEAKRLGIAIEAKMDAFLPPLYADPILIEQVLLNLLKNAVEATRGHHPKDPPAVVLKVTLDSQKTIQFAVIDEGGGIAENTLTGLFQPFFSTKAEGMGMGLNICRSIIELHQGRLWVEPNPHASTGGAIFRFSLSGQSERTPLPNRPALQEGDISMKTASDTTTLSKETLL
jgi:PAS domain S-box-containing protein